MCESGKTGSAYACNLGALKGELKRDHIERSKRLFAVNQDAIQWNKTGFELILAKNRDELMDVTQWVCDESLCCPFLLFTIEIQPGSNQVVVKVSEPEGAAGFLRSELKGLGII